MYINSENVKVYPTAFRGSLIDESGTYVYNPESKLNTEFNNVNRINMLLSKTKNGSFVVDYNNDVLEFVIYGYWFKVKITDEMKSNTWYANIRVSKLNEHPEAATEYEGWTLSPVEGEEKGVNLDSEENKFIGLSFDNEPLSGEDIHSLLVLKDNEVSASSKLKFTTEDIEDKEGKNISEQLTTGDLNISGKVNLEDKNQKDIFDVVHPLGSRFDSYTIEREEELNNISNGIWHVINNESKPYQFVRNDLKFLTANITLDEDIECEDMNKKFFLNQNWTNTFYSTDTTVDLPSNIYGDLKSDEYNYSLSEDKKSASLTIYTDKIKDKDSLFFGLTSESKLRSVTMSLNNLTSDAKEKYLIGSEVTITLTPVDDYGLPESITVTGVTCDYDNTTGKITFTMPSNNVTITASVETKWYENQDYIDSLDEEDVGLIKKVYLNNQLHDVRLIGIDHDDKSTGGKAHTTWQFTNIVSDANGYSLATYWKNTNTTGDSNQDFINSSLRKAIDGEGDGDCHFFQKDNRNWTIHTSILSMLPSELQNVLKTVTKQVATGSGYTVTTYNTKLFPLSYREMTQSSSSYAREEGTTYAYWKNHDNTADRIIYQLKGSDGARTDYLQVTSGDYSGTKYSYAGYNSSTTNYGGLIWLRSPYTNSSNVAWGVGSLGILDYYDGVCNGAYGVSPAFCI